MKQTSRPAKKLAEGVIKDIRRATRRQFSSEEKIRVVLEGLRGEDSIAELCRREGIAASMDYGWSKEFLEAGKKRLSGDINEPRRPRRAGLFMCVYGQGCRCPSLPRYVPEPGS